ncbi:hypothetical protein BUALT_Bualt07G0054000 [Buddleja alternifolia]|uniref:Myb/SANT-like domain-containing protein n=1 Tax=Buddleja alternifolia TaxID=168488 RepID=A0AAV6XJ77_9LAMI|nr:hypothetical protein BUALT_Bualt07G0054000 [Buddleja alternifolia]
MMSNAPCGKSTSNISQSNEKRSSARWDDFSTVKFIELCEDEIGKGNKPNSHFNINGWKNIVKRFNEMTGKNYDYKQLRNHYDAMKKDWILFKKLMNKEMGVGWNAVKNSLDASDEWWESKLKKEQAPTQMSGNGLNCEQEMLVDDGESKEHDKERVEVGDSDDIETIGTMGYDTNSGTRETMKRKLCEENDKGKKKVSGAAALKEDIHFLLQFMATNKNTACSTPSIDITIGATIEMLRNVLGIAPRSELWNYACNLLSKKEMREVFASQPCHESRLSWLEFNYDQFKKSS